MESTLENRNNGFPSDMDPSRRASTSRLKQYHDDRAEESLEDSSGEELPEPLERDDWHEDDDAHDRGIVFARAISTAGPFTGRGPRGFTRSNKRIVEEVSLLLSKHGHLDAHDIEVHCEDGVVSLTGSVRNRPMKRAAEDCADAVFGVEDVTNQLRIRSRRPRNADKSDSRNA